MEVKRELGMKEVFCISSGAMISSGLFILPGVVYGDVGPAVILAYLAASLIALPTVLAKAELSSAIPKTGGIFVFTDRSMGPMMGTLGGLSSWFSLALKSAFALFGMGIFATILYSSLDVVEIKALAIGFCLLFMVLNITGVKHSARAQVWMVMTLIGLLLLYVLVGLFHLSSVGLSNFGPFFPKGISPVLSTSGLVFVSFAGSTKVAAVAGEVRKPGRNIPYGMLLSWAVVSLLYLAVIFVTVGIMTPGKLSGNETPISDTGGVILGTAGIAVMSIAGILAFVSTGNAGIMSASRDPMAMGVDGILPGVFGKVNRLGTPHVAIIVTSSFMIAAIAFTDVKHLAGYASTLTLILFIFANLALIFMRESNIKHYRPKYRAPFYPYVQMIGIAGYILLIIMLGWEKLLVAGAFILLGVIWYLLFAYGRVKREYALLRVAERVMGEETESCLLDEELREVLISRDQILRSRFKEKVMDAEVFDLNYLHPPEVLSRKLAYSLSRKLGIGEDELTEELTRDDRKAHMMSMKNAVILSYQIKGRDIYDISLIRTRRGAMFTEGSSPVHCTFVILFSKDEKNFYLNSLMWLMNLSSGEDFEERWKGASRKEELKKVVIDSIPEGEFRRPPL